MKKLIISLSVLIILNPVSGVAETPEEKGKRIGYAIERHFDGYGDMSADETITITNRYGEEKIRRAKLKLLEVPGVGDKGMVVLIDPADVKGTASLLVTYRNKADDFWIYIPALRRVKRITGQNKRSSFFGTAFSNEDAYRLEPEKFTYLWIKEEEFNGMMCDVIDRFPIEKTSGYKRQRLWIDQDTGVRIQKVEFFNLNNKHVKTLYFKGYQKYIGKIWQTDEMFMVNHHTGKSTSAKFFNWKFQTGLKDSDFSLNRLKRAR